MNLNLLPMRCSFCRRRDSQVAKLISNHPHDLRRAYICDACVAVCDAILQGDHKPLGAKIRYRISGAEHARFEKHCSFCRKPQHEVGKLLSSRVADRAICAACVGICNSILGGTNQNPGMPAEASEKSIADAGVRATQQRWRRFWRKIFRTMVSPELKLQGRAASPAEGAAL